MATKLSRVVNILQLASYIRTNVWSHTLPDGSLSDVGVKNEALMEQAIEDSKANGDHKYIDNPYIIGGALEHMCPWTGKYQIGWDTINTNGMEQITAVTGGRMLSHLAHPTTRVLQLRCWSG